MLGSGPVIGVWASISRYEDGVLVQLDRGGNPTINPFINPDGEKNPPASETALLRVTRAPALHRLYWPG
jgi:hypothetical protein